MPRPRHVKYTQWRKGIIVVCQPVELLYNKAESCMSHRKHDASQHPVPRVPSPIPRNKLLAFRNDAVQDPNSPSHVPHDPFRAKDSLITHTDHLSKHISKARRPSAINTACQEVLAYDADSVRDSSYPGAADQYPSSDTFLLSVS